MIHANPWHVLAAALAAFVVGGVWYGPLFGKAWRAEMASHGGGAQCGMGRLVIAHMLLVLIPAFFLGHLLGHIAHSPRFTMMISTGMALGFVVPCMLIGHLYGGKSARLMAIDAGHWILAFAAMGGVFVALG